MASGISPRSLLQVRSINVCEEWERREVKLTKVAVEAGVWQGDLGHRKGHTAATVHGGACHACPVAAARARPLLPRVQRWRRVPQGGLPLEEGRYLGPDMHASMMVPCCVRVQEENAPTEQQAEY